jgi:hypothetical protein
MCINTHKLDWLPLEEPNPTLLSMLRSAFREIRFWVRNRHRSQPRRVAVVAVAASLANKLPTLGRDLRDDFAAAHMHPV